MAEYSTSTLIWQGVTIEIRFCAAYCAHGSFAEHPLAHLELRATLPENSQLPMSSTGYKSHFTHLAHILDYGSAQDYVRAWLDHEVQKPEWQDYLESQQQLSLF